MPKKLSRKFLGLITGVTGTIGALIVAIVADYLCDLKIVPRILDFLNQSIQVKLWGLILIAVLIVAAVVTGASLCYWLTHRIHLTRDPVTKLLLDRDKVPYCPECQVMLLPNDNVGDIMHNLRCPHCHNTYQYS